MAWLGVLLLVMVAMADYVPMKNCTPSGSLDLRVAKALGPHGYDTARVSVVSVGQPVQDSLFSYSARFRYRWEHLALSTGLVTLNPGLNAIHIGDSTACVRLPPLAAGIRGVIFGDPCTGKSAAVTCRTQADSIWNVEDTLTTLLNLATKGEGLDFWSSVGDNFYDKDGAATASFYNRLSSSAKSTFMSTVVGNGDFWPGSGTPDKVTCDMPFGHSFMQWYAQDTMAGKHDPQHPFNFSVVPPAANATTCKQDTGYCPSADNFFSYYMLGNVGFIGFSGHDSFEQQQDSFEEACQYFEGHRDSLQEVVLLGHWAGADHGCPVDGDTGSTQRLLRQRFSSTPCGRAKAFYGHVHCNERQGWDCGSLGGTDCFQIGAAGANDARCDAHWGVLYFDSTNGTRLTYFQLGDATSDTSKSLLDCLQSKGLHECTAYGTPWLQ